MTLSPSAWRPRLASLRGPRGYVLAVLALPVLVLWHSDDPLFTPPWWTDPWYYLGFFQNLVDFKRDLFPNAYFGSRLSWLLPGFAVHSLFPPLAANFVLHIGVHTVAALSFFTILRRTVGARTAFLSTLVFSVHPWLWAATGWDYVNGAGIAYLLLAMAALTCSAQQTDGRRALLAAGAGFAGMVYANFLLLAFVPLLLMYYAGLIKIWRAPFLRFALRSAGWLALGFVTVSAVLAAANYFVTGTIWFYGSSWNAAHRTSEVYNSAPHIWGAQGLAPWLWFPLLALVAAAILIPVRLREHRFQDASPAVLFAAQLFLAVAGLGYLQSRSIAMLGFHPYAAYLIPFTFLTAGSLLWPAVDRMSIATYVWTCVAVAVGFAAAWYRPGYQWTLPSWEIACLGGLPIAAGMLLGRRPVGTWLVLAGLLIFSAHAVSATAKLHGTREGYQRVSVERENIEHFRNHGSVRFWFDETDPGSSEYVALSSLYLDPGMSKTFPSDGCATRILPGTLIVVPSARPDAAELARQTLSDCWRASAMKAELLAVDPVARKGSPYRVVQLRAAKDLSAQRPLRVGTTGSLEIAPDSASVPLPPSRWKKESPEAVMSVAPGGIDVRTPRGDYDYTMSYPTLTVPETGRYRLALRYSDNVGEFAFGAFPSDNSRWLAVSTVGYWDGDVREIAFTVALKAGDAVILRIANNNNARDGHPASFRMLAVTATLANTR